jgi:hypothetical protein
VKNIGTLREELEEREMRFETPWMWGRKEVSERLKSTGHWLSVFVNP